MLPFTFVLLLSDHGVLAPPRHALGEGEIHGSPELVAHLLRRQILQLEVVHHLRLILALFPFIIAEISERICHSLRLFSGYLHEDVNK